MREADIHDSSTGWMDSRRMKLISAIAHGSLVNHYNFADNTRWTGPVLSAGYASRANPADSPQPVLFRARRRCSLSLVAYRVTSFL